MSYDYQLDPNDPKDQELALQFQPDKEGLQTDRIDFGSPEALAYLHEQFDRQAEIVANL